jgi:transcriptional regulator with XRE-family HTH domain
MRLTSREHISPLFLVKVGEHLFTLLAGLCGVLSPFETGGTMLDVVVERGFRKRDDGCFPPLRHVPAVKLQHIGAQIITLRKRKGMRQRELTKLVGVSPPTLIELERHATGRLPTLDRVLVALGAGAYLAPIGSMPAFYVHAGNSSTSANWETPKELLEPLYSVFGGFDLDPCSPTSDGRTTFVKASAYFTEADDGLSLPWFGVVYMNPPYGRSIHNWTAKAKAEVEQGNADVVLGVIPARPDTHYWHRDIAGSARVLFLKGRLKFGNAEQVAPFPSCLVLWGSTEDLVTKLQAVFPTAWLSR